MYSSVISEQQSVMFVNVRTVWFALHPEWVGSLNQLRDKDSHEKRLRMRSTKFCPQIDTAEIASQANLFCIVIGMNQIVFQ